MVAAASGNIDVVLELLHAGALVDLNIYNMRHERVRDSALLHAVREGHLHVARLLLQWGADRCAQSHNEETAVLIACQSSGECFKRANADDESLRVAFLRLLCEEGLDDSNVYEVQSFLLNTPDRTGATPFVHAMRSASLHTIRWMVAMGCDVTHVDPTTGMSPIEDLVRQVQSGKDHPRSRKVSVFYPLFSAP